MKLDFQGLPLDVNDRVIFMDLEERILRYGTITSIGNVYISVLADGLWTTFRVLSSDTVKVNGLSLPVPN